MLILWAIRNPVVDPVKTTQCTTTLQIFKNKKVTIFSHVSIISQIHLTLRAITMIRTFHKVQILMDLLTDYSVWVGGWGGGDGGRVNVSHGVIR